MQLKLLIAAGMAVSLLGGLVIPVAPALAANDRAAIGDPPASFHAFSTMPLVGHPTLRPMTDDELATVEGAAGNSLSFSWANINLGIIVQFNICAICTNVTQGNAGSIFQVDYGKIARTVGVAPGPAPELIVNRALVQRALDRWSRMPAKHGAPPIARRDVRSAASGGAGPPLWAGPGRPPQELWEAAGQIGAKRLPPFVSELIDRLPAP